MSPETSCSPAAGTGAMSCSRCTPLSRSGPGGWDSTTWRPSSGTRSATSPWRSTTGGRFLGKPYEPNGIVKNDIEFILFQRKPGGYRRPTLEARLLSVIPSRVARPVVPPDLEPGRRQHQEPSGALSGKDDRTAGSHVQLRGGHGVRSLPRLRHHLGGGGEMGKRQPGRRGGARLLPLRIGPDQQRSRPATASGGLNPTVRS